MHRPPTSLPWSPHVSGVAALALGLALIPSSAADAGTTAPAVDASSSTPGISSRLAGSTQAVSRGDTLEALASTSLQAVVRLDVETDSGSRQGSGFIVSPDGRILTNYHVVGGARRIQVKLASGDVYERVKILQVDERRDIAILEIAGFELPTLPLGNSERVRIGTEVIAIGSPLGLENTVSTGIVSGRRTEPEGFELLQITAPASQGSSGGPVLSGSGEVVGIAASQMRSGQNLNFAVPINYARGLLNHLDGEPVVVLSPESPAAMASPSRGGGDPSRVNASLAFDLDDFHGFSLESEGRVGDNRLRRTRVAYRWIEGVEGDANIERYAETETTERSGPFDTPRTVQRERSRTIVAADDLRPISTQGEVAWSTGGEWRRREFSLRFDDYRVTGTIVDTAGQVREVDRELPRGVIVRNTRHLAFATLAEDSLIGRSVEFVTFEAASGEMTSDRYDVRDTTTVRVGGREYAALRVNLASGLDNATAYFTRSVPRVLLRREMEPYGRMEEATDVRFFGRGTQGPDADPGDGARRGESPDEGS